MVKCKDDVILERVDHIRETLAEIKKHLETLNSRVGKCEKANERQVVINSILGFVAGILVASVVKLLFGG